MFASFRRPVIWTTCLWSVSSLACAADSPRKPNVIIIIADDQGYHDLGVQGAKDIQTPNVDALAAGGTRFTQGYVTCPVCSPSRAGLLTGRYQVRFGHEFNPGPNAVANFGLPTDQKTFADYMKEAGYATGAVGKWHEGSRAECMPLQRGFDQYYGFLGGAHSYLPVRASKGAKSGVFRNNQEIDAPPYLTYAFNKEAVAFINRHKEQPFFLYLAYNAIHTPLQEPPGKGDRFAGISDPKRRTMARMLAALDEGVGAIRDTLKKNGIEENTFIFYTSDNGGPTYANGSRNEPLRGFKGETLEGGIRVPMFMRWPGHVPEGKTYDRPIITLDVLPTVLAITGAAQAKDGHSSATAQLDGVDLLPYLTGRQKGEPHRDLFWRFGTQFAVRSGDYKLVKTRNDQPRLFNLAQDIGEKTDLMSSQPQKARELQGLFDEWNAHNKAPLWRDSRHVRKEQRQRANDAAGTRKKKRDRRGRRQLEAPTTVGVTTGSMEELDE
jgi:arylsulfatase A-like enzyme